MKITVSAPGKIHFLGEHMVVYGKPAILAAIDKRLYVQIKNQKSPASPGLGRAKIKSREEIIIHTQEKNDLVWETIKVFQKNISINKLPPLEITITSQIPIGSGLGSSAALASALIGALMKTIKNIWNPHKINELTYEVEKIAHGNPSGADNTTVVFGGLVWFRREFDFLKSIWSLPMTAYKIPQFMIIDSGRPAETTKEMVASVANLYAKSRKKLEEIFTDQEMQTKNLLLALKNGDQDRLAVAIKQGENNLEKIGVVGNFAKKIIREIESLGGAAKICGAGGKKSGSGILLGFHRDLSKLIPISKKYNIALTPIKLGEEGIRIESANLNVIE